MADSENRHSLPLPAFEKPPKILIVLAPYYRNIADALVAGATRVLEEAGAEFEIVEVPGALEIPAAIAMAHRLADFDGYVALGCVIRGETTHYDTVCNDSSRGLALLNLQGCAVGNGILTVDTPEQAETRAAPGGQDKGGGAAAAALHLVAIARKWAGKTKGVGFRATGEESRPDTAEDEPSR